MKQKYYDGDHVYYTYRSTKYGIRSGVISTTAITASNGHVTFNYQIVFDHNAGSMYGVREHHCTKNLKTAKKRCLKEISGRNDKLKRSIDWHHKEIERNESMALKVEAILG